MRFERVGGGELGYCVFVVREVVAVDEDVLVGCAATFGGYYVGVILFCYFVDDAYETFLPAILVVFRRSFREKWVFLGGSRGRRRRRRRMAVFGVCEAGFDVGQAGEIEGHD